ncbi:tyrosine-type recombinase/integrase [Streptomyces sp. NPDC091266]|uniref:tyrosine-type recombinase/integrase n=1 Tax=Streptomyces sp. NPDC091266 TaxID=3365978 RepID=UPI003817CA18
MVSQLFLLNCSPYVEDLSTDLFARVRESGALTAEGMRGLHPVQRAVAALGFSDQPPRNISTKMAGTAGVPAEWSRWAERWYATSTLTPTVRRHYRATLLKAGRWLAAECPDSVSPERWTRQTCASWTAAVERLKVGDFVERTVAHRDRIGQPLSAAAKSEHLSVVRAFFRDCQEWEWFPRRFDPQRSLTTPRSIRSLIGPNPRVIADDAWAKLLWAGLNLEADDLFETAAGPFYPLELVRAVTLTWLFSGQRSDEIARLRVGCIRWQREGTTIAGDSEVLARDAVCLLDVPTHVRPEQPRFTDRRTGEQADLLFSLRARPVSPAYINSTIIPMLCSKAGVPAADVRGNITSHRARSTIASQLYNAKEPMTLFELQAWLGHRSPQSTQHYAKISPNTLPRAYRDAGYFTRNLRTIEVLVDRDAVASGAAAAGEPWQYYDLGHGLCTYTFFEQCPHRMACARCDFYTPKASSKGHLLEAKENLQKMLASIPLTDEEQAAIDDGQSALDQLLERLADTPTPSGQTPRQLNVPVGTTFLPIVDVQQGKAP